MTQTEELPDYYNDLDKSLGRAWKLLTQGSRQRKSPMHTLTVAGIDGFGNPTQRIMVLREVSDRHRCLRFHTDVRSSKVSEFGVESVKAGPASILAYDPDARVQLRLTGKAWVESDSGTADVAWHSSTNFARRCYLSEDSSGNISDGPTSGLPRDVEGIKPNDEQILPGRENFAVLLFEAKQIEWLYLSNAGHRRARWTWDDSAKEWNGIWLVP